MNSPVKKMTFLHVLIIVLAVGFLIRGADFTTAIAEDAPKAEKVDAKDAKTSGEAVKVEEKKVETKAGEETVTTETTTTEVKDGDAPPEDELSNADIGVLQQLAERRRQLDGREKELDQREALLLAAQKEIAEKYKELDGLRSELKTLLGQQSEAQEKQLTSLVKVYEGMKPKDAAAILDELDATVLLQVMSRMSERKMSPILAEMRPEVAREVTRRLAIQRKLPEAPGAQLPNASSQPNAAPAPSAAATGTGTGNVPVPPKP